MISKKLLFNSTILSLPGLISIFVSLLAIPIHLKIAGIENYGNYILFHLILSVSFLLNLGISKSIVISINNFPKYREGVAFEGVKYTSIINFFIILFLILTLLIFKEILSNEIIFLFKYCSLGIIISQFYLCFEGIFLGNERFKFSSLFSGTIFGPSDGALSGS